ncbi:Ubiquitin-like protein [Conoideocrella luteorostrata]|uniref:Ubiquitin-like protein ATG12 n=1 Tax=Conoideocrella luteorostrata TaxID=1105319 RepID=A0AAJ0CZ09_9HYPO|nr:Ubiquitin-like protein [Conoideocrella luteorostrata]
MDTATTSSPSVPEQGSNTTSPGMTSPVVDDEYDASIASPELPLTMSASVMLADLPRDATAALASAGGFAQEKVVVKFKPVGSAPSLTQELCKISATRKFEEVVRYLRRKLKCKDTDSVFLYVNSAFAPSLDEVVGNLHQCFKNTQDQLIVAYSTTPAFG